MDKHNKTSLTMLVSMALVAVIALFVSYLLIVKSPDKASVASQSDNTAIEMPHPPKQVGGQVGGETDSQTVRAFPTFTPTPIMESPPLAVMESPPLAVDEFSVFPEQNGFVSVDVEWDTFSLNWLDHAILFADKPGMVTFVRREDGSAVLELVIFPSEIPEDRQEDLPLMLSLHEGKESILNGITGGYFLSREKAGRLTTVGDHEPFIMRILGAEFDREAADQVYVKAGQLDWQTLQDFNQRVQGMSKEDRLGFMAAENKMAWWQKWLQSNP